MLRKLTTIAAVSALSVVFTIGQAQAAMKLRLTDGATAASVTSLDGDADGVIIFGGPLGNWGINATIGSSKDAIGSATDPQMRILSFNAQNSAAGDTLTIELTDTDFNAGGLNVLVPLLGSINGTDVHELRYRAWVDDGNGEFAKTTALGDTGAFFDTNTHAFSNVPTLDGTYSLTMEIIVTHSNRLLETNFDAGLGAVPEPGSLALLGLGLGLLGVSVRRRRT